MKNCISVSVMLFLLITLINLTVAQLPQECPVDVSPCYCVKYDFYQYNVRCFEVPMDEVKATFNNLTTPFDIQWLDIVPQPPGDFIPADLLGQSRVRYSISFGSSGFQFKYPFLSVDPLAFRSSSINNTNSKAVYFYNLNMDQLDLKFLDTSFQNLSSLNFNNVSNMNRSLPTLPPLPDLAYVSFDKLPDDGLVEGIKAGNGTVLVTNKLTGISVSNCRIDDDGMSLFLDWVSPSTSQTLERLGVYQNNLTTIPWQLSSFVKLESFELYNNRVDLTIQSNAFIVQPQGLRRIDLQQSRVVVVEDGAFRGNYSSSMVGLNNNLLTRLEEGAFKSLLQDMSIINENYGSGVYIDVYLNKFDCYSDPCHLAWLLRDNRQLLKCFGPHPQPECEDRTLFENLSPSLFDECP